MVLDRIKEYRQNWKFNMERMVDTRIPKQAFEYRTVGTRDCGRSWKKWSEIVKSERAIVQVVQKKEKKYKVCLLYTSRCV